ncbi:MAG TPA: helix-turn-helix domain-containing protein [Baekduia sp.]|nr:helix-turn-helix domain-containing protein [Baekduia sp.]
MSSDVQDPPPPPGLRERKKQQTRQLIAEAARKLFAERGFEQVTVAEVARAADVSQQTVFNHFPTKEDLVFWRLGAFEDDLLATVRERPAGESALAAFRRFLLGQSGLLRSPRPEAREELAALTRTIDESPALLAREQQIFAQYTDALAALLAQETSGDDRELEPWVAANAMTGVHRALVRHARRRVLAGARHPALADEIRQRGEQAFALIERGLGSYGAEKG